MDEPNISTAIKNTDLNPVKEKVQKIITKGERLIKSQEGELHHEDEAAKKQMEYVSYYYSMAVFQVVIVVALGLYQIFSFKKFLLDYEGKSGI